MKKLFNFLSWLTMGMVFASVLIVGYWLLAPYEILVVEKSNKQTVLNENRQVRPGEHLAYQLNYCKYLNIGSEITISFVDGFVYNTTPIPTNLEMGCHSDKYQVYVPRAIPLGSYTIKTLYHYHPNPIRTIDVVTHTETFTVIR